MIRTDPLRLQLSDFGGQFFATESLWSILSKICWANSLTGFKVSRLLGSQVMKSNLLFRIEPEAVQAFTGLSRRVVEAALARSMSPVFSDGRLYEFAYSDLCYCPVCMAEHGFHSYLFQFPLFTLCCHRRG